MTARNVAIGRIIAGSLYLAFPRVLVRPWTGTHDRRIDPLGRAIGARDLAIGLGALFALGRDVPARGWFEAALLADAADAAATLLAFKHLPRRRRWLILAAAVVGASASQCFTNERRAGRSCLRGRSSVSS
jgi:hypothetical protein